MPRLLYSKKARRDLLGIWRWIAKTSGDARADEVVDRIERRISILKRHASAGPARLDIDPGARMLVVERWVILYSLNADKVQVERILDSARDITNHVFD